MVFKIFPCDEYEAPRIPHLAPSGRKKAYLGRSKFVSCVSSDESHQHGKGRTIYKGPRVGGSSNSL
ncbi:unnamed protein product [Haemonchus placei]|uniref:Ovule protein n=1 Tax=Haemonchus placei TaxID=6290 RepID=A0A0N4W0N4_HAEPC|nr:unnamed protein product [Haemonchus placei]